MLVREEISITKVTNGKGDLCVIAVWLIKSSR